MKKWMLLGTLLVVVGMSLGCSVDKTAEGSDESATVESVDDTESGVSNIWEKVEENTPVFVDGFATVDIYGSPVTKDIFAEYDLTLVNLFATWCGPCVAEMPELAQIQKDMHDKGVNVVAVVMDSGTCDKINEEIVETAKALAEASGVEFTFMIPDATNLNGYLYNVTAVPESFFIDKDGKRTGESYVGARDYDAWMEVIESELAKVREAE